MKSPRGLFALGLLALFSPSLQAQLSVPAFTFQQLDGKAFQSDRLDQSKPALILYFDPWCDHCNTQAQWISERPEDFKRVQILFVTFEAEQEAIKNFRDKHFSDKRWSNVVFLQDPDFQFENFFGYSDDPLYIYCYKPGGGKGKYFGKEQKAEILLKFL